MSILDKSDLLDLQQSDGIVPDDQDTEIEIWSRSDAYVDGQSSGGVGVDENGYPVTTSSVIDNDPENDTPGFDLIRRTYGRIRYLTGRETDFGAQNTSVMNAEITLPAIDGLRVRIRTKPGDELRAMTDDGIVVFQATGDDYGATYGVLLKVRCQRIEQ